MCVCVCSRTGDDVFFALPSFRVFSPLTFSAKTIRPILKVAVIRVSRSTRDISSSAKLTAAEFPSPHVTIINVSATFFLYIYITLIFSGLPPRITDPSCLWNSNGGRFFIRRTIVRLFFLFRPNFAHLPIYALPSLNSTKRSIGIQEPYVSPADNVGSFS